MVGGARGWVAGRAGFCGVLATWVRGRQLQPPGSELGTQPPCATQVLIIQGTMDLNPKEIIHLVKKFNNNSYLYLLKIITRYAMLCHMLR